MFYGHAEARDTIKIKRWLLIDLAAFRAHLIYGCCQGQGTLTPKLLENSNGGGSFVAFDSREFPESPRLLKASSDVLPPANKSGKAFSKPSANVLVDVLRLSVGRHQGDVGA